MTQNHDAKCWQPLNVTLKFYERSRYQEYVALGYLSIIVLNRTSLDIFLGQFLFTNKSVRNIANLRDIIQIPYAVMCTWIAGIVKQLSIRTDIKEGERGHQIEKIDRFCSLWLQMYGSL